MKAVVADTLETLESYRLKDVDMPEARPGQVVIRVAACGVGYVDSLVALGRYQVKPPVPHTPGQEVAGTVEAVGEGVSHVAPGDRVMTMTAKDFAEYAVAAAPMVVKLPDALSFAEGASLPLNYVTALHALQDRGAVAEGETALVFGAAGGVGSASIQVAKALGARVIAAASTEEKRAFALAHGADLAIDTSPEGWRDRLKERKRYELPTENVAFPMRLFARASSFGWEQSFGTNGATFVGFGWRQHKPPGGPGRSDGSAQLAG